MSEEFEREALFARASPEFRQDLLRLADQVSSEGDGVSRLVSVLLICASGESDPVYLEAARVLDRRFPDMPGENLIYIAGAMRGPEVADLLAQYLFEEPGSREWPFAYHAVSGLRDNPAWTGEGTPTVDALVASGRPALEKLAILRLLLERGFCDPAQACSWAQTFTGVSSEHQRFVDDEIMWILEFCQ